jgi:hypothetical protein
MIYALELVNTTNSCDLPIPRIVAAVKTSRPEDLIFELKLNRRGDIATIFRACDAALEKGNQEIISAAMLDGRRYYIQVRP